MMTHLCNRCTEIRDYNIAEDLCRDCLGVVRRQYEEMLKDEPTATTLSGWMHYNICSSIFSIWGCDPLLTKAVITVAVIGIPVFFLMLDLL